MFGALNKFISRLDGSPQEQKSTASDAYGFQVLRNSKQDLAVEPWFDFIIGINGRTIDNPDPNLLASEIANCAGSSISLGIWSAKGSKIREIFVSVTRESPSLGLAIQWTPLAATDDVWHILDVAPNSPADVAGLLPYGDYVIGSYANVIMKGESGLGDVVEQHIDQPLKLLVYNHEYNVTRPVEITPSRSWGGIGALGCTLGFGALHRIPPSLDEGPPTAPGETMFESPMAEKSSFLGGGENIYGASSTNEVTAPSNGYTGVTAPPADPTAGGDFLIPANMSIPSAVSPPPPGVSPVSGGPPAAVKKKVRAYPGAGTGFDDLFNEGEAASRERDNAPKAKGIAPPPKAGGGPPPPPKASTPVPESPAPADM